ncbi:hypothetical protein JXB31_04215 [Candidatus Woesearchaeota archaeon]|nr:hypothetical protein [Candidatus Woesearchaeota archaeon]
MDRKELKQMIEHIKAGRARPISEGSLEEGAKEKGSMPTRRSRISLAEHAEENKIKHAEENKIEHEKEEQGIISSVKIDKIKDAKSCFIHITKVGSESCVCFVDGGSAVIIDSPSLAVGLIRAVGIVVKKNRCIKAIKKEFYVMAESTRSDEEGEGMAISYRTRLYGDKGMININSFSINSLHKSYSAAKERFRVSKMIDIARRLSEISVAKEAAEESLGNADIVVLDGNLKAMNSVERCYLDELYSTAKKKGVLVCAIQKSCTKLDEKGDCLLDSLSRDAPKGIWFCRLKEKRLSEMHRAEAFVARMNNSSKYLFFCEIFDEQAKNADLTKLFGFFSFMSRDLAFPGYPYWLIKADCLARVADTEKEMASAILLSSDKEIENSLMPFVHSLDAHQVLDNIR